MSIYKKMLLGLGGLLAILMMVIIILGYATHGLTRAVSEQLAALHAGNIAQAYSDTSQDFRAATSLRDFEDFVNHYAALKDNKSMRFTEKSIKDGTGTIKGTLYSTSGVSTQIEYTLVKEGGEWKILGIQVIPVEMVGNEELHVPSAEWRTYDNKDSRYTMQYPAQWEYEKASDGTIIFSGKPGTAAFFSTVNIQTVLSKKTGGDYSTVSQFMADIKHQAMSQSPGAKFLESGPIVVTEKNGVKDQGVYIVFSYKYKGKEFKQWQVVVLRGDEQVFYAWAYTSLMQRYMDDYNTAKAMFESWVIY